MKYLQSINEYHRVVGFKYSEPREKYTVSLLCSGQDITKDKINIGFTKKLDLDQAFLCCIKLKTAKNCAKKEKA